MTIIEKGDYLLGKKTFPKQEEPYQKTNAVVACLASMYRTTFPEIEQNLLEISSPSMFYSFCPQLPKPTIVFDPMRQSEFLMENGVLYTNMDRSQVVSSKLFDEVFYFLKVQNPTEVISSKQMYFLQTYFLQFDGDLSWLPRVYPEDMFEELCSEGYLPSGYTPQSVISSMFDIDYNVLTDLEPCIKGTDGHYRLYIPSEDAIAKVPAILKDRLSYDNMLEIGFDGTYVTLKGKPLHTFIEGCQGVYIDGNSFDLVRCL